MKAAMKAAIKVFLVLLTLALVFLVGVNTQAFEIHSSRGAILGGALSLQRPSATDFLSAPGLVGSEGVIYFDAGVARRFDLRELDLSYVAVGYRRGNLLFALGAQQFGPREVFAEQVVRGVLGYKFGIVSASVALSVKRMEFGGGYTSLNAGAVGFGVGVNFERATIRATVDNLNEPSLSEFSPKQPRKSAIFAEYSGSGSFTLSASARFEENTTADFGLGQTLTLTDFAKLSWGISSEPLVYGAGFEIRKGHVTFIYAGSIHSVLGYTQSLTLNVQLAVSGKRAKLSS